MPASRARPFGSGRAEIASQSIVDGGGGDGRVAGPDADLVDVADHVADRVQPLDARALVRIDQQVANLVALRPQLRGQLALHLAAKHRVDRVELALAAI